MSILWREIRQTEPGKRIWRTSRLYTDDWQNWRNWSSYGKECNLQMLNLWEYSIVPWKWATGIVTDLVIITSTYYLILYIGKLSLFLKSDYESILLCVILVKFLLMTEDRTSQIRIRGILCIFIYGDIISLLVFVRK